MCMSELKLNMTLEFQFISWIKEAEYELTLHILTPVIIPVYEANG